MVNICKPIDEMDDVEMDVYIEQQLREFKMEQGYYRICMEGPEVRI